jgi:hypothetical protein
MGFFDEAEVDVNEIPEDPYGFGNEFWPVRIIKLEDPKLTEKGDKYGMVIKYIVDHPKFATSRVGTDGWGNWQQLPVPKIFQEQGVPWNPKYDDKHAQALFRLSELYKACGFPKDKWSGIGADDLVGAGFLAKLKVQQDDNGFFQIRTVAMKPLPKDGNGNSSGGNEFHPSTTSNPAVAKTPEQILEEEMNQA